MTASATARRGRRSALGGILALCIAGAAVPSGAQAEPAEAHLDCMALYGLLRLAVPSFADLAEARRGHARRVYQDALPSGAALPRTGAEIEADTRKRLQVRGAPVAAAVTPEDERRETDAFLADIHACDALYAFDLTPVPWRD